MNGRPDGTPLHLKPREVLDIHDGEGLAVDCLHGALWITQADDPQDIVLEVGQSFILNRPGLALVTAPSGPSLVVLRRAACTPPRTRQASPATRWLRPAA